MTHSAPGRRAGGFAFTACTLAACAAAAGSEAPSVTVTADRQPGVGLVEASVDIDAPPALVWRVMTDCARVSRLMVNVKYCRVIERDPAGRWDVREQVTRGSILPGVRTVLRSDYDAPRLVRFHRVDGDFKVLDGEWKLDPLDGGARTRVTYDSRVSSPFPAPGMIVRAVLRKDVPRTLANLRDACETPGGPPRP
jgi:uncharacterized protein YndB with AHSA1/START domain